MRCVYLMRISLIIPHEGRLLPIENSNGLLCWPSGLKKKWMWYIIFDNDNNNKINLIRLDDIKTELVMIKIIIIKSTIIIILTIIIHYIYYISQVPLSR